MIALYLELPVLFPRVRVHHPVQKQCLVLSLYLGTAMSFLLYRVYLVLFPWDNFCKTYWQSQREIWLFSFYGR